MAAPTILTTKCETGSGTSIATALPTWSDGDLVLTFVGGDGGRTFTADTGWTIESQDAHESRCCGAIISRVMQTGDGSPTHTMSVSDQWACIHVVIDAGTFNATTPVDAVVASSAWTGTTGSTTMTAKGVTTTQADCLALAVVGVDRGFTPFSVTTTDWTETHSADCNNGSAVSVVVADKDIATADPTGDVDFSQNTAEDSVGAVIAIAPAAAAGVTVDVPLATFTVTGQVPTIATGVAVEVPLATFTVTGQVPTIATGVAVDVPLATFTVTGLVPTIDAGAVVNIEVPLATFTVSGQVPSIATGVAVEVPLATFTVTGQVPTIEAGAPITIEVPLATFTVSGQVPSIATGVAVEVPVATFTITGLLPTIVAGVQVTPFASLTIETDTDRTALFTHDNATLVHNGAGYLVVFAEQDGFTLDGGTTVDGWLEVQILASDIDTGGISEHDLCTISGDSYQIAKIDLIGGGMAVMYLEPR